MGSVDRKRRVLAGRAAALIEAKLPGTPVRAGRKAPEYHGVLYGL